MNSLITKGFIGNIRTNYLPGGGTISLEISETVKLYIEGDRMDFIQKLNEWYVGDTVTFSGTVAGFASGSDPTDYTIKFDITQENVIKQTLSAVLNSSGEFTISELLGPNVVAGSYVIFASLWWNSTKSSYQVEFDKKIKNRPSAS